MSGPAHATLLEIIARHGLSTAFSDAVLREVQGLERDPGIDAPELSDLTALPFVTIDYPDSMDLDQAMHIARSGDGGFVVRYALADAAHFVRPGTALFQEALRRGVSHYLPGQTVPMLPPRLSEGIVSLLPDADRRALVFEIDLDLDGAARQTRVLRARIRSRAKLSYSGVQAHHDAAGPGPLAGRDYTETLELLREVGELRLEDARRRDVIQFDRADSEVELADDGTFCLRHGRRNAVSRWNEQISLLCNIEGARLMARGTGAKGHVQPIYRVHEPPEPAALDRLQRIIDRVTRSHGLPPQLTWRREAGTHERLADYLERLRRSSAPEQVVAAVERQALISNQRSVFAAEPGRHYALGVRPYARFSAPMREIVGIFTHKEALEKLGLAPPAGPAEDETLREQVIDAANAGKERQRRVEREVMRAFIDQLLGRDLDLPAGARPVRDAMILGVKSSRIYVRLDQPPVELKVYTEELEAALGQRLVLDEDTALVPASGAGSGFALGRRISLRVARKDRRDRWRLTPVDAGR